MKTTRRGFTLVELIVVIAIITLLMVMLVVMIRSLIEKARYAKTAATITMLDKGCASYRIDFGVFPPADKGERSLHHYLGIDRFIAVQKGGASEIKTKKPPIIEFPLDVLKDGGGSPAPDAKLRPVPILDAFEGVIQYANPGKWNKKGVDLWSRGADGKDQLDPAHPDFDDVTNWNKEH
jgi:prepilin-type N-terminal cleavage/methylation domain-containing protein